MPAEVPDGCVSHRFIVLKRRFKLSQSHVGGSAAVIPLYVVFIYLQGLGGVRQGVAIALGAQVRQASVAVLDGVGWIELQGLCVVLDRIFVIFLWKTNAASSLNEHRDISTN